MPAVPQRKNGSAPQAKQQTVIDKIDPSLRALVRPIDGLEFDPMNARLHPEGNIEDIKASLTRYGQRSPIVVDRATGHVMKGNGTLRAARELGWTQIAAAEQDFADQVEAVGYGVADNRTGESSKWDFEVLAKLDRIVQEGGGQPMVGWSEDELAQLRTTNFSAPEAAGSGAGSLAERFLVPPFSVLDARQGYWQERKRAWIALGIQSELGRGDTPSTSARVGSDDPATYSPIGGRKANATPGGSLLPAASLGAGGKTVRGDGKGRKVDNGLLGEPQQARSHYARTYGSGSPGDLAAGFKQGTLGAIAPNERGKDGILSRSGRVATGGLAYGVNQWVRETMPDQTGLSATQSGTSIFDPVLCELAYRWFTSPEGKVLDPFAGGSVRGIVAAKLGRKYHGIDLSARQLEANREQAVRIVPDNLPQWVAGDSLNVSKLAPGQYDFLFSCPPYFDLERYSDDPKDLSVMTWEGFCAVYEKIIAASVAKLKPDSFACFVVGDIRDRKTGYYRGLVPETIAAFAAAGCRLYNEAILVTAVGSLSIRVGKQFASYRKLGKTHQNVLVFCKGDAAKACKAVGPVDVDDLDALLTEQGVEVSD